MKYRQKHFIPCQHRYDPDVQISRLQRTTRCSHTWALKLKCTKFSVARYETERCRNLRTRSRGLELGSMTDTEGGGIA